MLKHLINTTSVNRWFHVYIELVKPDIEKFSQSSFINMEKFLLFQKILPSFQLFHLTSRQ